MRPFTVPVIALMWTILPVLLESCCGGLGGGGDTYYDIDDMVLTVHSPASSSTIPPSKLSELTFEVRFDVTYVAMGIPGGSALHACSPAPPISNQQVAAVAITSNATLATAAGSTPAGESLNFMFRVNSPGHIDDPVSDLINNPLLDNYFSFHSDIVLASSQTHTFTFKITLDNGKTFTLVSRRLELVQG